MKFLEHPVINVADNTCNYKLIVSFIIFPGMILVLGLLFSSMFALSNATYNIEGTNFPALGNVGMYTLLHFFVL